MRTAKRLTEGFLYLELVWSISLLVLSFLLVFISAVAKWKFGTFMGAVLSFPLCICCVVNRLTPKAETLPSVPSWSTVRTPT